METREGRDLFKVCRELIRGSEWEGAMFETTDTESRKRKAKSDQMLDQFYAEFIDIEGPPMSFEAVLGAIAARKEESKEGA